MQARPNVSQSAGQMTALAAFIHSGTSCVGDVAEREQLDAVARGRELAGEVGALDGAGGVVGEEQVAAVGVEAELLARGAAVERAEALDVDRRRAGSRSCGAARPRAPGDRRPRKPAAKPAWPDEVHAAQDRRRDLARARVVDVVAVQRDDPLVGVDRERGPRGEPEVRVDDVEALALEAPLEVARGADVGRGAAGIERVQLDVEVVDAPQRLDLVADESAQRRPGRGGVHVGDDERAHAEVAHIHRVGTRSRASRCTCV